MIQNVSSVLKAGGIKAISKYVLLVYANYSDAHGYCWPSEKRLMADTGLSRASVQRAKVDLVAQKLIKQERRRNRKTGEPISNLVRLNLELIASRERPVEKWDDDLMERITFSDDNPDCPDLGMTLSEAQGMTQNEAMTLSESYLGLGESHAEPQREALSVSRSVSDPSLSLPGGSDDPRGPERESEKSSPPAAANPLRLTAWEAAEGAFKHLNGRAGGKTRQAILEGLTRAIQGGLPPSSAVVWLNGRITPEAHSPHLLHKKNVDDLPEGSTEDRPRWEIEMCWVCDDRGVTHNPAYTSGTHSVVCLHGEKPKKEETLEKYCSQCSRHIMPSSPDPCGRCQRLNKETS